MKKIFIDGSQGTTGLKIYKRFENRNDIELLHIDEAKRKDPIERAKMINSSDITFLCLPDAASIEAVELVEKDNVVIIDTSTAHRTNPEWAYVFLSLTKSSEKKLKLQKELLFRDVMQADLTALFILLFPKELCQATILLPAMQ